MSQEIQNKEHFFEQKPPRWNLSTLYTNFSQPDWLQAISQYDSLMDAVDLKLKNGENLSSNSNSIELIGKWLVDFLDTDNKCGALEESLNAYAYSAYSTDTTNTDSLNNLSMLEEKAIRSEAQGLIFRKILTSFSQLLPKIYTSFPQLKPYTYLFNLEVEMQHHQMSPAEENLANDLQRYGGSAWSRLHEQIISNMTDEETGKTFNEIRNEAYDSNRNVRRIAWQKETALLKSNEIPIAACLNNIKGATVCLNRRRSWAEAINRSLVSSRLSQQTLDALISALEESLPFWRDYLNTKAKILGLDKCAFYDLFAPLETGTTIETTDKKCESTTGKEPATKEVDTESTTNSATADSRWTFSQARSYIIEKFSNFSTDMGSFAKHAFDNEWIDAEVRKGKVGGAFCIDYPTQGVSRVLSNFTGMFSDVTTLAHELGHAYHHWCIKDLEYSLTQYPMTLAETASVFAETIVMKDIFAHTNGSEKMKMLEMHLSDSCQVIVDILSRFYFEKSVFEERKENELSAQDFCRLMADAQDKTYGSGLSDERHPYIWAVKSHYYLPDLDFYNFPYAFGLLFALGLYARSEKEGPSFAQTYASLLRETGRLSCEDVCSKAGFDITTIDFWRQGLSTFKTELDELKSLAGL